MGPQKTICLEVFIVNNLVFRWPKPLFFVVLGAYGRVSTPISGAITPTILDPFSPPNFLHGSPENPFKTPRFKWADSDLGNPSWKSS